jgi:hypothetical protein
VLEGPSRLTKPAELVMNIGCELMEKKQVKMKQGMVCAEWCPDNLNTNIERSQVGGNVKTVHCHCFV